MKLVRVLSRLVVLLAAAGAFVGLTAMYYDSSPHGPDSRDWPTPTDFAQWQAEIRHQPSAPEVGYFSEFAGTAIILAIFVWMGRMLFRLRLNPAPRNEGQLILLGLYETPQENPKPLATRATAVLALGILVITLSSHVATLRIGLVIVSSAAITLFLHAIRRNEL
ncbi:MAG TPA: hypothetical protein VN788_03840 [Verrucomicrobiae bacterium]|nr:hypothetical protein [Verrucomicrobiae bacterium]HXU49095.1 hypothetical protein [Candidatus Binatia bacterium]